MSGNNDEEGITNAPLNQFTITEDKFWFFKTTTGAPAGDHMLQLSNNKVSCDGILGTDTTEFNLYTGYDGTTSVCVIHCASGLYQGNLIQIKSNGNISFRPPSEGVVFSKTAALNVDDVGDDVLFEYFSESEDFYQFRLRDHNNVVLGFSDSGIPSSAYNIGSEHTKLKRQTVVLY